MSVRLKTVLGFVAAVAVFSTVAVLAADSPPGENSPSAEKIKFFEMNVRPVLAERCLKCHGSQKQESGLRLDTRQAVLAGGDSGAAVVPGEPEESLLIEAIRYDSYEMPPDGQLPKDQIAAIERWVATGAAWPPDLTLKMHRGPAAITDKERAHWSFRPVADPPLPEVNNAEWCRSPIDRFILRRLEQEKLEPAAEAEPIALVRRVYFDLIGLPPTPDEIDAYLADPSPNRYERLVDRLLDDPRYGETWGRHWLDVVRFAESDGWRQDAFRAEAYRYRDYVIRSLNEDKPYNRFVAEQLAGDEIDPGNPDAITATALLRHGIYEYNQRDVETQWDNILNEITDVTGDAFLGLGMACARCHDHKFDPIPQTDYFRLRAFFEPLVWREDQPQATVAEREAYEDRLDKWKQKTAEIRGEVDAIEWPVLLQSAGGQGFDKFAPHLQAMMLKQPENRTPREQQIAMLSLRQLTIDRSKLPKLLKGEQKNRWDRLQTELKQYEAIKPKPLPERRFAASDVGPIAPPTRIPGREDEGDIAPGFLSVLGGKLAEIEPPAAVLKSTGRRTALARWLTDDANPLSTRVTVNRVWMHHFGVGLAATPDDFGRLGEPPSHPELLDWLTRRFIDDGWRLKELHRRMMNSAVYRQTSLRATPAVAEKIDPDNRLLWRMNTRRLDAEAIRDAMLYVSGELDQQQGGPSVAASSPRRSVYVKILRNTPCDMLAAFDMADGFRSTARRNVTTTPLQALMMINGPFVLARGANMARRLVDAAPSDAATQIRLAFRWAYSREPTAEDVRAARAFLQTQAGLVEPSSGAATGGLLVETMPQTGGKAALLKPGSKQPYLTAGFAAKLPDKDFTVEAFVLLESLYPDATVRTIVAQWDANPAHPGWSLGVTSEKSHYRPRNLILQLIGDTSAGKRLYEVVPSGIHLELNTPYFVAASVSIEDTSAAGVRFYVDDLSIANEPPQIASATHQVIGGYRGTSSLTIGGRDGQDRHQWDGLIDEVRLSRAALPDDRLLIAGGREADETTAGYWRFENSPGMLIDSSESGLTLRSGNLPPPVAADPETAALVDFCHVLLNSNEFLYVD